MPNNNILGLYEYYTKAITYFKLILSIKTVINR